MSKQVHVLVPVTAPENMPADAVVSLVSQMVDVGFADAVQSSNDGCGGDADAAAELVIGTASLADDRLIESLSL